MQVNWGKHEGVIDGNAKKGSTMIPLLGLQVCHAGLL